MFKWKPFAGLLLPATLLAFVTVAMLSDAGHASQAGSRGAAPTAVAVVDLQSVINDLEELKTRNTDLEKDVRRRNDTIQQLINRMEIKKEDLNNENLTREQKFEVMAELVELEATAQARRNANQRIIDINIGESFKEVYRKALATIEFIAQRDGWDIVLLDDRAIDFPEQVDATQAIAAEIIQQRKVLYAVNRADISQTVLDQMNNDFAANINRVVQADE